tara:strand:+ start:7803 stop:8084 length:282 start_codon:yes stop_codon:yes gene_type:complete
MTLDDLKTLNRGSFDESKTFPREKIDSIVSFQAKVPEALQISMYKFIERHPNWDQYRLIQAALAGFLIQNGINKRSIARLYVGNMFSLNSFNK